MFRVHNRPLPADGEEFHRTGQGWELSASADVHGEEGLQIHQVSAVQEYRLRLATSTFRIVSYEQLGRRLDKCSDSASGLCGASAQYQTVRHSEGISPGQAHPCRGGRGGWTRPGLVDTQSGVSHFYPSRWGEFGFISRALDSGQIALGE